MSKKTYGVGFTRTSWGHIYFTAETLDEAQQLLEQVTSGKITLEALPDFSEDLDGGDSDFEYLTETE